MLTNIFNGAIDLATDLNPVADNIRKSDKKIVDILIANGISKKDIVNFVDVYKSDVKEYINFQKATNKQAKKMIKAKEIIKNTSPEPTVAV